MQHLLSHNHVLLLQGKMGSFFHRFATFLQENELDVSKINFNAGDAFFYNHKPAYNYTGTLAEFDTYLKQFVDKHQVDAIVCFGDCRPYHVIAASLCERIGLSFFVFEEGYLRPDYITLQEYGINGNSRLDMVNIESLQKANDKPLYTRNRFYKLSVATTVYYIVDLLLRHRFPHYEHYRGMSAWEEAGAWLKAPLFKLIGYIPDKILQKKLVNNANERYFLVSLQVHNDSQITHHSDYHDVTEFIDEVIASFATNADKEHLLVFKHHPLDRGHRNYRRLIKQLTQKYEVQGRVFYGCDMHLPTLIKHSIGMVTINSTTGLQSIYHKKPTKVMGRAIYNIDKLADPKPLAKFWQNPMLPDNEFYGQFREYLIEQTQLNGSFYGDSPWMKKYIGGAHATNDSFDKPPLKK